MRTQQGDLHTTHAATIRALNRLNQKELLLLSTAIGLVSTFAAPWTELRGAFSAWRIAEWHTFWRGASSFLLTDVVATSYAVPVEFATAAMRDSLGNLFLLGAALGTWHAVVFVALIFAGARTRIRGGASVWRVAILVALLFFASVLALYILSRLFALPSSLSLKVDFRSQADIHTDSLIWSTLNIFPAAPALALGAVLLHVGLFTPALASRLRRPVSNL